MNQPLSVVVAFFVVLGTVPTRANSPHLAGREKLAASLAQAETAWRQILDPAISGPLLTEAEARYAAATTDVVEEINAESAWNWRTPRTSRIQAGDFVLELVSPQTAQGAWKRGGFDRIETIHHPRGNRAVPTSLRAGIGAPVLAIHEASPARFQREPGLPPRGYRLPATAILDFSSPGGRDEASARPHRVKLEILDPSQVTRRRFSRNRALPVAADFAAPVDAALGTQAFGNLSFLGVFRPQQAVKSTGIYSFGPFDATKIPVIFIHGLDSDPSIWTNAITDLLADPELNRHYQYWYFFYPTGVPALASARRLRDELDRMRAAYDPAGANPHLNKLILVGHSVGGLLAHLLVVDSGRSFYDAYFGVPLEKLPVSAPTRNLLRRDFFFMARTDVDEAIFICTPHRGSRMADWGIARFLSKLIAIPEGILPLAIQLIKLNVNLLNPTLRHSGLPRFSGIDSLSPSHPYFRAIEKQAIQRPFHSIIGDRGRGDTPNSSDGIVGYHSSHWAGAQSEQIVPFGHSCTGQPEVFWAIHQLLQQELHGQKARHGTRGFRR